MAEGEPQAYPGKPQLLRASEEDDLTAPFIRAEVNLLVFPFFALNNREVTQRKETVFRTVVTRAGQEVEISWIVSANPRYGYPGPFDKKLFRAIEHVLTQLKPPIENPIPFSTYELCRLVGKGVGGRQYQGVKEILRRIVATTIRSQGAYFHKGRRRWIDDTFHLYERVIFKGEEFPDGRVAETNYLFLGDWYRESLNNRYVKPIDYEYYNSLKSTIAQRLYEILGVKFYPVIRSGGKGLRYRYSTLCQLLPAARQKYRSKAREKLDPAHDELIETGFLADVRWEEAEERDWLLYYSPGLRLREEIRRFQASEEVLFLEAAGEERSGTALPQQEQEPDPYELEGLVRQILEVTGDEHSWAFYRQLARRALCQPKLYDLVQRCLSEVKYAAHQGRIRTSKGAVFVDKLKRYCQQRGIDLKLRGS